MDTQLRLTKQIYLFTKWRISRVQKKRYRDECSRRLHNQDFRFCNISRSSSFFLGITFKQIDHFSEYCFDLSYFFWRLEDHWQGAGDNNPLRIQREGTTLWWSRGHVRLLTFLGVIKS